MYNISEVGVSSAGTLSATEYNFTYDSNGNITQIKDASGVIQNKYYYDNLGQLIREDNLAKNKTYTWEYDEAGNRTSEKTYAYTTGTLGTATSTKLFTYGDATWGDLLTKVGTQTIQYDEIGNPVYIGYYDEDLGYFTSGYYLTWEGRELLSYEAFEGYEDYIEVYSGAYFTYNADGIRNSAEYDGETHEYLLDGSTVLAETWSNITLVYIYDENGSPIGIQYRTTSYAEGVFDCYFFEKNLQGDIIAIYNSSGTKVGTYTYDAWGNVTKKNLSTAFADMMVVNHNPFRYRSYYYEGYLEGYYLQSRYYIPAWGRFLNGDTTDVVLETPNALTDKNLFSYCDNNPIMRADYDGEFWAILGKVALGVVSQYIGDVIANVAAGETGVDILKPTSSAGEYIAAGVTALIPGAGIGNAIASNVVSEAIVCVENIIIGKENNLGASLTNIAISSTIDFGVGVASDKITSKIKSNNPNNYASFASEQYKLDPNTNKTEIKKKLSRIIRRNHNLCEVVDYSMGSLRNALPY